YLNSRPRQQREANNIVTLDDVRQPLKQQAMQEMYMHCHDVMSAVDVLPDGQRAVLILMALERPSYTQGAQMLGIAVGTFRSRLSRARHNLRRHMAAVERDSTHSGEAHV